MKTFTKVFAPMMVVGTLTIIGTASCLEREVVTSNVDVPTTVTRHLTPRETTTTVKSVPFTTTTTARVETTNYVIVIDTKDRVWRVPEQYSNQIMVLLALVGK
jgi:hypothetical protein